MANASSEGALVYTANVKMELGIQGTAAQAAPGDLQQQQQQQQQQVNTRARAPSPSPG